MNEKTCPRTWEVEARRDGRLSEAACALLEEHVARCEICAREQRALARLSERLRSDLPGAPDDLSVRRLRRATLEKANAAWMERGAAREASLPDRRRRLSLAGALVLAGALAALAFWTPWRPAGPTVQVTEGTTADWTRDTSPGAHRVVLREGAIELRIERNASDPPFFVVVPDGEIQDVGTVFRVEVKSRATTSIDVTEGAVVFRRPDRPEVHVSAGEHWPHSSRAGAGGAAVRGPGGAASADPTSAADEVPGTQPTSAPGAPGRASDPAASGSPAASAASGDAGPKNAGSGPGAPSATGSSSTGRSPATGAAQAASGKPATSTKPISSDGLEEDLAYLRVIALLRDGRRAEAKLAAKEYLRRFPRGFRRVEVEGIAR